MNNKSESRRAIENIAILLTLAVSICIFIFSFIHIGSLDKMVHEALMMSRMVERIFAVTLIITVYNLYKRKRIAWIVTIVLVTTNLIMHILTQPHMLIKIFIGCEVVILAILIWGRRDFFKASDRRSVKRGILIGSLAVVGIIANAGITYFVSAQMADGAGISYGKALMAGLNSMFGFDTNNALTSHRYFETMEAFITYFSWGCVIIAMLLMVRPFLKGNKTTKEDLAHARKLVLAHGQNAGAYLTLEEDKLLYFGETVDGVVAYGIVGDTVVINGDPICDAEDFVKLLDEFKRFCQDASYNMFFLSTTNRYLDAYKQAEFEVVKCGEEARFDLQTYDIAGKKGAKMRANINKATRGGLTVKEYKVAQMRDSKIEYEIDRISSEWLSQKNSSQLAFTLGGVGLDDPMDKRYFYAYDEAGTMQGFIVFCPFATGYMADVTRRANDAPGGIMHKIMFEAFQVFKAEGIKEGSMGLAPLVNLIEEGQTGNIPEKLLNFIYENMNNIYEFKNLYRAKEAYSPSRWEPGYFVYSPKILTPQMVYAVVAIQNPQGMMDYVKAFFKGKL
jgi:Uncharacterized conserved protein